MRARIYTNGGNMTGGFTFNGGVMTGALLLAGNPSEALEAAAKQYVDSSLVNLNATNVSTGILPTARLPSFTGDLVKPAGSSTINLAPTGVTVGDFIKPTIDEKGRVVGGGVLTEADVPNMSWNKISVNRPDTLAEYGITDGVNLSGGILSGFLTYSGSVTHPLQAVNKQYVDVTLSNATGISIGDIIRKPYTTTPAGFLKCNGAEVDKTTYNTLYSVIGDRFNKNKNWTSGRPWQQQYVINDTQSTEITGWVTTTPMPNSTSGTRCVVVTKNRVYLIGGWSSVSSTTNTVYYALINSDGTLGAWTADTNFPIRNLGSSIIAIKNKIYVIGGYIGADVSGADMSLSVYCATIKADGSIGTWTVTSTLPAAHYTGNAIVTSSKIYLIGGATSNLTGSQTNKIYSCNINTDGSLSSWTTEIDAPFYKYGAALIVTKNRVYLCGGEVSIYTSSWTPTVYTASVNADGTLGSWTSSTSLPVALSACEVFVTKNKAYLIGGTNNSGVRATILMATINADGTLGSWTFSNDLPAIRTGGNLFAVKNKLYYGGGYDGANTVNTTYVATISGGLNDYSSYFSDDVINYMMPGSGKPWEQQYQINTLQNGDISGWVATTSLPIAYGITKVIVTKNRVYVLGGWNNTSGYLTNVYSAIINQDGTLGAWTLGTPLPQPMGWCQTVVTKNRVYMLGGFDSTNFINTVYSSVINSDGTLGAWTLETPLPVYLSGHSAFITKNRIYILGGITAGNAGIMNIYSAPINSSGIIGAWSNVGTIPEELCNTQIAVTKNRVYLIGSGYVTGLVKNKVYSATINSNGVIGTFTVEPPLPITVGASGIIVTKNRVYLFGGFNGTASISTVHTAVIDNNGVIGPWSVGTSLPVAQSYMTPIIVNNKIYLIGGYTTSNTSTGSVLMASLVDGVNDYSPYYDGTIVPADPIDTSTTFALPDLTQNEKFDTVSYIKY